MYFSDEIKLVGDAASRSVFAQIKSVTMNEAYIRIREGLSPAIRADVHMEDYDGEEFAEYGGMQYRIVRTYQTRDTIELYLEERVGA